MSYKGRFFSSQDVLIIMILLKNIWRNEIMFSRPVFILDLTYLSCQRWYDGKWYIKENQF